MDEKPSKKDIELMSVVVKNHFTKAFYACDGNKAEISKVLGIAVRTVRVYCHRYGLNRKTLEREKLLKKQLEEQQKKELAKAQNITVNFTKEFLKENKNIHITGLQLRADELRNIQETGYRSVTPEERDEWYNRDRF